MNEELTPAAQAIRADMDTLLRKILPDDFDVDPNQMLPIIATLKDAIAPWEDAPSVEVLGALAIVFGGYACALVMHREKKD